GQRGRPHRRTAGRVPGHAGGRRGHGLRDRVAHREDPGRRADRPRTGPDAPRRGHSPRARHHDRPRVLVLHPGRGATRAVPRAGHRPDGRTGRDCRRAGARAGAREREGDLRGHSRPLHRPDHLGELPCPAGDVRRGELRPVRRQAVQRGLRTAAAAPGLPPGQRRSRGHRRGRARRPGRRADAGNPGRAAGLWLRGRHVAGTAPGPGGPPRRVQRTRGLHPGRPIAQMDRERAGYLLALNGPGGPGPTGPARSGVPARTAPDYCVEWARAGRDGFPLTAYPRSASDLQEVPVPTPATDIDLATAAELGQQLRVDSVRSSTSAGSGHPTSSMSAADLMAVLMGRHLRYDWDNPGNPANDHLIFSKGHASPLVYSIYKAPGVVSDEELMTGYRRFGSRLEGHPTPAGLPWTDVATGSLGQGLPDGVGVALAGKYLDELPYRVWVLCGDSEMAEGSMWEAFDKASHYKLANLIAIVDVNRLGQRGPTDLGWDLDAYRRRTEAFGARVFEVDGHDLAAIDQAMAEAGDLSGERPAVILARTLKGRGASEVEDREDWHGKPLPPDMAERAIVELGGERHLIVRGPAPAEGQPRRSVNGHAEVKLPAYDRGQKVATRKAYGEALAALGARPDIVAMDGEVSNSTYANLFAQAHPDRFFEMYIAEQQMVAAAVGVGVRGYRPFA